MNNKVLLVESFKSSVPLFMIFCLFGIALLPAQTGTTSPEPGQAAPAILVRGPLEQRGLPLGYANAVPCRYGLYRWGDEEIKVYYSDVELELEDPWTEFRCGRLVMRQRESSQGRVVYLWSPRGWGVFIVHGEGLSADACAFITAFSERLTYFLSISEVFSFPAVLEIASGG